MALAQARVADLLRRGLSAARFLITACEGHRWGYCFSSAPALPGKGVDIAELFASDISSHFTVRYHNCRVSTKGWRKAHKADSPLLPILFDPADP